MILRTMMKKPKFSIITPVYIYDEQRFMDFGRCVQSVNNQTNQDYEHIVVNDGSLMPLVFDLEDERIKVFYQDHLERVIAFNKGMSEAKGEWICFLDSDDEYTSYFLECVENAISLYPEYKMFNFGSIHVSRDYKARPRDAFKPAMKKKGHEMFGGGNIVNGTYVFHRSVYEKLGGFIDTVSPWDFSIMAQDEFPEIKPMFTVDHPDHPQGYPKELGNPWGQDFYLFYKYTRKYHSKPIDAHIYIVHPSRVGHALEYETN